MLKWLVFAALILCGYVGRAQQTAQKYVVETDYLLYLPEGYDGDTLKRWPVMMFLHGVGECGDDIEKIKVTGVPALIEQGKSFPFIIVSPQSPRPGWDSAKLKELVGYINSTLRTDEDRFYLTGLSMGGYGTWTTAQNYPDLFAAIVPICGGGYPAMAYRLTMPIWAFHGDADDIVDISQSQAMIDAVREHDHRNVRFTVYHGVGHDSWTETYNNPEVYEWMLSHSRPRFEEVNLDQAVLQEYCGRYRTDDGYVDIVIEDGGLRPVTDGGGKMNLMRPTSGDKFFTDPTDTGTYCFFDRDDNSRVVRVNLYSGNQVMFSYERVD